jgi:hypothetical protein
MPFFVYVAVLITAVFSVVLEWDALVVPSSATRREMRAVSHIGTPVGAGAQTPDAKAAADKPLAPLIVTPLGAAGGDALAQKPATPAAAPQPLCDIAACAAAYLTFRASDCTYIPSLGERRLCTKGKPPQ